MSHVGNFVIARYFSSLPPPFHAFPRLYTELFSFPLPPKTSLPHESRTCLLVIFAHMHAQYKIPASIYAFTFVRVRHAFFRVPFLSVPFFPLLLFPLSLLIDSPRALSTILFSRYLELRHCSFSVHGIIYPYYTSVICGQENTDSHLRNASPLYLYKRCINFCKSTFAVYNTP